MTGQGVKRNKLMERVKGRSSNRTRSSDMSNLEKRSHIDSPIFQAIYIIEHTKEFDYFSIKLDFFIYQTNSMSNCETIPLIDLLNFSNKIEY